MNKTLTTILASLTLATGFASASPATASAQQVPLYNTWQTRWDRGDFDRRHVILGTVVRFWPYRVVVARRNGDEQTIDLKYGTSIRPTGATPSPGDRIAVIGYYSNGTFIANRIVLR